MNDNQTLLENSQFLTFHLAGEQYAIDLFRVKEIIPYNTVTKVPQASNFIHGVMNLRGSVVTVVDLALKFGLTASPITDRTCIVIVEAILNGESTVTGIIADSVSQVIDLAISDILPAPAFGTYVTTDFLRGLGKEGDKFLLILDIDKALSPMQRTETAYSNSSRHVGSRMIE